MTSSATSQTPAVVVGAGVNGLGVLRSLARARVPVIVLDSDARQPGMRSRYGRKVVYPDNGPNAVIDALEALADDFVGSRAVLFLTQEGVVSSVSAHRHRLANLYRFTLTAHTTLARLMRKDGFHAVAEAAGAPVPRTLCITKVEQLETLRALRPPLVVKPSVRHAGYGSAFRKAYRLDSVDEAQVLVQDILPILPDVVVQEWIEGSDSDIYFCLQHIAASGETTASFVGRKIRSWPPQVGGTARCAPAPEAAALKHTTAEFFRFAGVTGLASMEYKRDVRSGEFFMVEPTLGRTDYQEEVATLNGVNIPLAGYRSELDLVPVPHEVVQPVRVWRDRANDRRSAALAAGGRAWEPVGGRVVDSLWRPSDPGPAVAPLVARAARRTLRLMRGSWLPARMGGSRK